MSMTTSKPSHKTLHLQPLARWGPPLITSFFSHCPLRSQLAFFHQALRATRERLRL